MEYIWLWIGIGLAIPEMLTPAMLSVWLSVSALVVFLLSPFIRSFNLEGLLFLLLSGILLVLTRPLVKRIQKNRGKIESRIIGQEVEIIRRVEHGLYEVKLDGKFWQLKSGKELTSGDKVKIKSVEGNKLVIE